MKNAVLLVLTLAVLAGLFVWLRPTPPAEVVPAPATVVAAPLPATKVFELSVREKKLVAGEPVLRVTQGDEVILHITSDKSDELHLHGYDLSLRLRANEPGELKFVASRSGRFDYELHHSHLEIGALEVAPK